MCRHAQQCAIKHIMCCYANEVLYGFIKPSWTRTTNLSDELVLQMRLAYGLAVVFDALTCRCNQGKPSSAGSTQEGSDAYCLIRAVGGPARKEYMLCMLPHRCMHVRTPGRSSVSTLHTARTTVSW
jgi:hypothetical protein